MRFPILRGAAAALLLTVGLSPAAQAAFTSFTTGSGNEPDLLTILDNAYGLENLERMHDFDSDVTDEVWNNHGTVNVTAVAKYAGFHQTVGVISGPSGGVYTELFTIADDYGSFAIPPSGTASAEVTGAAFRFTDDPSGSPMWCSYAGDNEDGLDHMISWRIVEGEYAGSFVVAWEDYNRGGDSDFNDLVLRIDGGGDPVPEPTTLSLIGLGFVAMAARRMRRSRAS